MPVRTMFRTWVPGSACSSVRAKFSSTTMVCAPESRSWWASSGTVYSGFTLTTMAPASSVPNRHTGYCRLLGSMIATRSPFFTPRDCSHAAKCWAWCSHSSYVISVPTLT
jgi:hypothetical protein